MTVVQVVMHDHKWAPIPDEQNYWTCQCGFFRFGKYGGPLRELARAEVLLLTTRIQIRLNEITRARLSSNYGFEVTK